jgi:hypothetical protein
MKNPSEFFDSNNLANRTAHFEPGFARPIGFLTEGGSKSLVGDPGHHDGGKAPRGPATA